MMCLNDHRPARLILPTQEKTERGGEQISMQRIAGPGPRT